MVHAQMKHRIQWGLEIEEFSLSIHDACHNSTLTCIKQKGRMERMYQAKWIPWWLHIPCGLDISLACWIEHYVPKQCSSMPADKFESLQQSSEPRRAYKLSKDSACRSQFCSVSDSAEMSDLGAKTHSSTFIQVKISIILSSICITCSQLMHCRVFNQNTLFSPTGLNSITNILTKLQAEWFGVQFLVSAGDNYLF